MTNEQIAKAKIYLADGQSLQQAAIRLGVLSRDLDRQLWKTLGLTPAELVPVKREWRPDF